jgi:orotate phosphoribosyltransferase
MESLRELARVFLNPTSLWSGLIVVTLTFLILRKIHKPAIAISESETSLGQFAQVIFTDCFFQPTAAPGELPDYIDLDGLLRKPALLKDLAKKISDVLTRWPVAKICFFEKDSGPLGVVPLAGLVASIMERPISIARPLRDVMAISLKGEPIRKGDEVVLVHDLLTSGFQILPAVNYIHELGAKVIAVVVCVDREEKKQRKDEDFLRLGLPVIKIYTLTEIKKALPPTENGPHHPDVCHPN